MIFVLQAAEFKGLWSDHLIKLNISLSWHAFSFTLLTGETMPFYAFWRSFQAVVLGMKRGQEWRWLTVNLWSLPTAVFPTQAGSHSKLEFGTEFFPSPAWR